MVLVTVAGALNRMPYVIRCYEGQDEWGAKKWLAHLNLGNDVYMSFLRGSKKEAEDAARNWYEAESKRFKHLDSSNMDDKPASVKLLGGPDNFTVPKNDGLTWNDWNTKSDNFWGNDPNGSRPEKEHHFAGKVWMVKGEGWDKQKKRVDKSEVEALEADGWKRGGPRS